MQKDYSLQPLNTLQVNCVAKMYVDIPNTYQLLQFIETQEWKENKHWILGGGSNTLFLNDYFDGIVLHPGIKGIELIKQDENAVYLQVGAGEVRDDFVQYCLDNSFGGIENLIDIPGNVGTSAVSNIGAYGQEVRNVIYEVIGVNLETNTIQKLGNDDCEFAYRDSIFKHDLEDKFIITHVVFKLQKIDENYEYITSYKDVETYFSSNGIDFEKLDSLKKLQTISQAIHEIRKNKLPNHTKIGTAGSYFKNPELSLPERDILEKKFPDLRAHLTDNETMKLSAGQLIELCGWKGKEVNKVKMYEKHALILINANPSGKAVEDYAKSVQKTVYEKFGVHLEPEVRYCDN